MITTIQLFPPKLIGKIPPPRITIARWMQAHSPGGDRTQLDDLVIYFRLRWKFGSYFVTGYDAETGESAGLLGRGPHGRPETAFWSSEKALRRYIEVGYGFERDTRWQPVTIGDFKQQQLRR